MTQAISISLSMQAKEAKPWRLTDLETTNRKRACLTKATRVTKAVKVSIEEETTAAQEIAAVLLADKETLTDQRQVESLTL
jgi:hypothetical protein